MIGNPEGMTLDREESMEQGPDELNEQTPEGVSAGTDAPSQQAANEEPESLDDTAMQRPPSDS